MSTLHAFTEYVDQPKSQKKAKPQSPAIFTAKALATMEFPPIKWIVPGILPEGLTILAGRPKLGKSWLALDIALAVARGDYCLGDLRCEQGEVIYLALEDNQRRLQSRIKKVSPPGSAEPFPETLELATDWPRCDSQGLELLRDWCLSRSNPRLIVVDVLAKFRPGRSLQDTQYEGDYGALKGLQELASEHRVGVVVVHHVKKGAVDIDPFEQISGTLGLTGAADSAIVLDKQARGCTLYGRGRDMEEYDKAVTFNQGSCRWTIQGEASEVHRTDERSAILDELLEATGPLTPKELQIATGMPRNNLDQLLHKMAKAGEVNKAGRGAYLHPSRTDLTDD